MADLKRYHDSATSPPPTHTPKCCDIHVHKNPPQRSIRGRWWPSLTYYWKTPVNGFSGSAIDNILYYIILCCYVMLCHATPRHATPRHIKLHQITLHYITLYISERRVDGWYLCTHDLQSVSESTICVKTA